MIRMAKFEILKDAREHDIFGSDSLMWLNADVVRGAKVNFLAGPTNYIEDMYAMSQTPWALHYRYSGNAFLGYDGREQTYSKRIIEGNHTVRSDYMGGGKYFLDDVAAVY